MQSIMIRWAATVSRAVLITAPQAITRGRTEPGPDASLTPTVALSPRRRTRAWVGRPAPSDSQAASQANKSACHIARLIRCSWMSGLFGAIRNWTLVKNAMANHWHSHVLLLNRYSFVPELISGQGWCCIAALISG